MSRPVAGNVSNMDNTKLIQELLDIVERDAAGFLAVARALQEQTERLAKDMTKLRKAAGLEPKD
jgi:cell division septum initiation protein DivIVA